MFGNLKMLARTLWLGAIIILFIVSTTTTKNNNVPSILIRCRTHYSMIERRSVGCTRY